ncbi:MAG: cache domain-containing protein, partial [Paenibacillaceae bacterium]|nr:cache domain-containing protein [Paenibacillaceae bacterium]
MRIKKSNFVSKFLLPYLLVLVIPIAIGTTIYQKTISVIETETARSNMTLLNQSKEIIDRRLDELDRIVQQIMLDPNLITYQYIEHPFDGSNTARTIEMKKSLVNYNLFNTFISNYYVLFSSSKLVMTPTSVYDLPTFYQQVLQRGDWNYETWTNLTIDQYHSRSIEPASAYTIEGKERQMVTYIQSLGLPSHTYATVVMLIDNQEFAKLLRGLDISDGGFAYIADQNGQIISYIADADQPAAVPAFRRFPDAGGTIFPSAQTGNVMTTYTTSSYNGWTYVVSQPAHIALQKATYIKNTMIAIFVLSLAAGLVIAILMAYRSFRPVRFLFQTIDSLKINNDALLQEMEKQRPMLRFAFFERLLKGELPHADDRNPVMERLGIRLDGSAY